MSKLKDLTNKQLELVSSVVEAYRGLGIEQLEKDIKIEKDSRKRTDQNINRWLSISKMIELNLFDMFELVVLTENNISNMEELREADLSTLKINGEPIPANIRESLDWKRKTYGFETSPKPDKQFIKIVGA